MRQGIDRWLWLAILAIPIAAWLFIDSRPAPTVPDPGATVPAPAVDIPPPDPRPHSGGRLPIRRSRADVDEVVGVRT